MLTNLNAEETRSGALTSYFLIRLFIAIEGRTLTKFYKYGLKRVSAASIELAGSKHAFGGRAASVTFSFNPVTKNSCGTNMLDLVGLLS